MHYLLRIHYTKKKTHGQDCHCDTGLLLSDQAQKSNNLNFVITIKEKLYLQITDERFIVYSLLCCSKRFQSHMNSAEHRKKKEF